MKNSPTSPETERIDLLRSGSVVSSLVGAFGSALSETRLTAMLGYLIALEPGFFCAIFGFRGKPLSVNLETRHASGRSDILIQTTVGRGVIEAKVTATDPLRQVRKYKADWVVLLTNYSASKQQRRLRTVKYLRWRDLEGPFQQLAKSPDRRVQFVSQDLLRNLREHAMVKRNPSVEIYAREINNEVTLALFLRAQIYGCHYEKSSRLPDALYFAPHFGQRIARNHPGVQVGISYIASIERVEVIETWEDFLQRVGEIKNKQWLNNNFDEFLRPLRKNWNWHQTKRYFVFLSKPRLVFNPPVLKLKLQKGKGFLGEHYFSFERLFAAWGC